MAIIGVDRTAVGLFEVTVGLEVRRFHAEITWGLLGLFTATMVCGEGLHDLLEHHHSWRSADSRAPDLSGHSGHNVTGQPSVHATHGSCACEDAADCPICSFFAQAHGLPPPSPDIGEARIIAETAVVARCLLSGNPILVYRSRAPPAAAC